MSDELISKQKILNTLKEWLDEELPHTLYGNGYGDGYDDAVSDIIKLIETEVPCGAAELPSVKPKTGRWEKAIDVDEAACECSSCAYLSNAYYNYCPNCGAKMEGVEE